MVYPAFKKTTPIVDAFVNERIQQLLPNVVALNAWYSRMGAISNVCLNK